MIPLSPFVLHCLSQRPSHTGSGVTLGALVHHGAGSGWKQAASIGVPAEDPSPIVAELEREAIFPLVFPSTDCPFPLPGMSDVMPYRSTVFSTLDEAAIEAYLEAWRRHLRPLVARFVPDLIHGHHVWLMSSILKDLAPAIPVVTHCHATGLRQMELCPKLAERVRSGCRRNEAFAVLHEGHARRLADCLDLPPSRIHVVGAGYRESVFHERGRSLDDEDRIVYAGKYSHAKGLPWLLDAVERLGRRRPGLVLHVAGDGAGEEAEALRRRMTAMTGRVKMHGMLDQEALAALLRRSRLFVLPSFYEGLPLVLVEARACGCRLVATDLPGIRSELAPPLGDDLRLIPCPRLEGSDVPIEADLPAFVDALEAALDEGLDLPPPFGSEALSPFTWRAVFRRVERLWRSLLR